MKVLVKRLLYVDNFLLLEVMKIHQDWPQGFARMDGNPTHFDQCALASGTGIWLVKVLL